MDPCLENQPRVIDESYLKKVIAEDLPKNEAGNLARAEKTYLDQTTHIRLDYKNILRIDHLWVLTNLKKLILNNNFISKIENIETLIHLTELDLSFNKITVIENLDTLVKLEKLTVFQNQIKVLENLDNLKNLTIFSIGNNLLSNLLNVLYLRKFSNLKSLNMSGNPCANEENFRYYIAVFLPDLIYYEYRLIRDSEKELGMEIFQEKYASLEQSEAVEKGQRLRHEKEERDAILHAKSFVEYLNTRRLFDNLFQEDGEGKLLLEMGDESMEFYLEFEENFISECKNIYHLGQQQYKIREAEVNLYTKCVREALEHTQDQAATCVDDFFKQKNNILHQVREAQEKYLAFTDIDVSDYTKNIQAITDVFKKKIHETWKSLMKLELIISEQLAEVNEHYERTISDMINNFIEHAQAMFTRLRSFESDYSENMNDFAMRYYANANAVDADETAIPRIIRELMSDKDNIINAISASRELHALIIDQREDTLTSNAKQWLNNTITSVQMNEINRNRSKVLEINHFFNVHKTQYMSEVNRLASEEDEDADLDFFAYDT